MNTIQLIVQTHAKVLDAWRDDDGYGNVDSDYMTMHLQIPTWGENSMLLARVDQRDDDDKKMSPDSTYDIKGSFFYEFPGKDWTRTYLHVDLFSVVVGPPDAAAEATAPQFGLVGMIEALTESHVTVAWDTFDPYEAAMFTSHAKLQRKEPREPRLELNQICQFWGHMHGTGRDQLVMEECTPLRVTRVER